MLKVKKALRALLLKQTLEKLDKLMSQISARVRRCDTLIKFVFD